MITSQYSVPIMDNTLAWEIEASLLKDEAAEWDAMRRAGIGIARAVVQDYREITEVPPALRILALIGKGNNGGDALIACGQLLADFPRSSVTLLTTSESNAMRPLAQKALQQLEGRITTIPVHKAISAEELHQKLDKDSKESGYHICLDGLLGMAFQPPLREPTLSLIKAINAYRDISLRAAVDLPSGIGDSPKALPHQTISSTKADIHLETDFSYATGIAKSSLFQAGQNCGRVRYIDLGFFKTEPEDPAIATAPRLLTSQVLNPLRQLRPATTDKRQFGHLFILGGSAFMPGALLMSVQAAVRSGVGLVTAFAPASVAAILAAQVPEAMWVPWPETPNGTLSPKALPLLLERLDHGTAVLAGPGLGRDRFTDALSQDLVRNVHIPLILDADALHVRSLDLVKMRKSSAAPVIMTPHMGEFIRMARLQKPDDSYETLLQFCKSNAVITVQKGPITRISDGQSIYLSSYGGPVLSRGGTGDLLAGMIGSMVAQSGNNLVESIARAVVLHGIAGQYLARSEGQVAVRTTQVLEHLASVLRSNTADL